MYAAPALETCQNFHGAENMKIAVTVKGCDAMGLYELAKRSPGQPGQHPDDRRQLWWFGQPRRRPEDDRREFGVDPDDVVKEEIDKGQFIIVTKDGQHKGISIDEHEGRRVRPPQQLPPLQDEDPPPGRSCLRKPGGVIGDKAGKATFVEGLLGEGGQTSSMQP